MIQTSSSTVKATQAELDALLPNTIARMDVDKKQSRPVVTITTK